MGGTKAGVKERWGEELGEMQRKGGREARLKGREARWRGRETNNGGKKK